MMISFSCGVSRIVARGLSKLSLKVIAIIALLAMIAACSSDANEPSVNAAYGAGGTPSQSASSEPGTSAAQVSAGERERIEAETRAFVAKVQAQPPPHLNTSSTAASLAATK